MPIEICQILLKRETGEGEEWKHEEKKRAEEKKFLVDFPFPSFSLSLFLYFLLEEKRERKR